MKKIGVRAIAKKFDAGWLMLPATPSDKRVIDEFCNSTEGKYITLTASVQRGTKTFEQVKTVWALISILFEAQYARKPITDEADRLYTSLINDYAERETDLRHTDKTIPISLSKMDERQADIFIQSIINEIFGYVQFDTNVQGNLAVDVKDIFQQFELHKGVLTKDPSDYDKDGKLLSTDEWVKTHTMSMASGLKDTLEIAHIVSKGSAPQYRNCCWNFLRLTHYEHIEIQHRKGWHELLSIYPHLIPRVRRAYQLAKKIDKLEDLDSLPYGELDTFDFNLDDEKQ